MDFEHYFSEITDPRDERKIIHRLTDIIGLSIIGVLAGCEGYDDIEDFGKEKEEWLKQYLDLPQGIPSHDTIQRLFESINPKQFMECFQIWVSEFFTIKDETFYHIDGKSNRRSMDNYRGKKMLHFVNVFAGKHKLSLAQYKVDGKSNEITAIPAVLNLLDIEGKTITIDAMGTQKEIAHQIVDQKGHYILSVKANQRALLEEIEVAFETQKPKEFSRTIEKDHGRIEERLCHIIDNLAFVDEAAHWAGLCTIIMLKAKRTVGEKTTEEIRYYISDLNQCAQYFMSAIRSHWSIENNLHWVLDMVFDEDHCRKRKDNATENFNLIRKAALNIIKNYKGDKKSLRRRRLACAWNTAYLSKLLES